MKKLIAKRPIIYQSRAYNRGEALPANDPVMTAAWLRAGSAAWETEPATGNTAADPPVRKRGTNRRGTAT